MLSESTCKYYVELVPMHMRVTLEASNPNTTMVKNQGGERRGSDNNLAFPMLLLSIKLASHN